MNRKTFSTHFSWRRSCGNALRRRLWRWLYAKDQSSIGTFFLDAHDEIGVERLVLGDSYENHVLAILDQLIDLLELHRGVALDVGANTGNHAVWFARRFQQVICIEPSHISTLVLEANLRAIGADNWQVHRCALGRRQSTGTLDVVDPANSGASTVREVADGGEFPIVTGDELWQRVHRHGEHVSLIKIDVEGAEVDVLSGLQELLKADRPLLALEVLQADRWEKAKAMLEEAGYVEFQTIVPIIEAVTTAQRIRATLTGRRWRLAPLPSAFQSGGYPCIVCLSATHASALNHRGNESTQRDERL